jgi:hypothetical protein
VPRATQSGRSPLEGPAVFLRFSGAFHKNESNKENAVLIRARIGFLTGALVSFSAVAVLSGCRPADDPAVMEGPAAPAEQAGMSDEVAEAMAQLSEEDRRAAMQQGFCPVTEEPLGSMGKPYRVVVHDRVVFLCCSACEQELRANPEIYLAKLDAA